MLLLSCALFDKVYINSYEGGGENYMSKPVIWGYARVSGTKLEFARLKQCKDIIGVIHSMQEI